MTSSIIDDVVEVSWITIILTLPTVLSYLSMCIIIDRVSIFAVRRCFFTSSVLCPIDRPVANEGLALMVSSRWFCYNNLTHHFGPLMSQSDEWRVLLDHELE
jgi:hypothetical protein